MAFPLIPLLWGIVGSGIGLLCKRKIDEGTAAFEDANKLNKEVSRKYSQKKEYLDQAKDRMNASILALGKARQDIYTKKSMKYFERVGKKLKNIEKIEIAEDKVLSFSAELEKIRKGCNFYHGMSSMKAESNAFLLLSVGACGYADKVQACSTLNWLATGILTESGRMVMLGGVAVAPILFAGSVMFSSKGKKELEEAKEQKAKVEAYCTAVDAICRNFALIEDAAKNMTKMLHDFDMLFYSYISRLDFIVSMKDDYVSFTSEEKAFVKNSFLYAEYMRKLAGISLMDANGSFIQDSIKNVDAYADLIKQIKDL